MLPLESSAARANGRLYVKHTWLCTCDTQMGRRPQKAAQPQAQRLAHALRRPLRIAILLGAETEIEGTQGLQADAAHIRRARQMLRFYQQAIHNTSV